MIAANTNLWVRAILGDDPKQSKAARKAIHRACASTGIFIPMMEFAELAWILKAAPNWDAAKVHEALDRLLNTEGVEVESAPMLREALALSTRRIGLPDNIIALTAQARGCTTLLTFDAAFAKAGSAVLLKA